MNAKDKLIFALDVDSIKEAEDWVLRLKDCVGIFKVGKELFTECGPKVVEKILSCGSKVFLDLKFHDIPSTVAKAGIQAAKLGVSIFNVHALGGREMMERVAEDVWNTCEKERIEHPLIIAVTILTSLNNEQLKELGIIKPVAEEVRILARLAENSGLDGVVCSPKEISIIKNECGRNFKVFTPGIIAKNSPPDDQKRTATAFEAVLLGSDFIVVGRLIRNAPDPALAAKEILEEMKSE